MEKTQSESGTLKLLREKQVRLLIPIAHSTLWTMVREGRFPSPVRLGDRMAAWKSSDIDEYIKNLNPMY